MTQFVASPEDPSRLTHIASGGDTRCGAPIAASALRSSKPAASRVVCSHCVAGALTDAALTRRQAAALLAHTPPPGGLEEIVRLLRRGLTDVAVARELGISRRTVVRRVGAAMATAGVATRFQWGYELGRAAGEAVAHARQRDAA